MDEKVVTKMMELAIRKFTRDALLGAERSLNEITLAGRFSSEEEREGLQYVGKLMKDEADEFFKSRGL